MIEHMKRKVRYILENKPETRNDDKLLYIEYLRTWHLNEKKKDMINIYDLLDFPNLSDIVRVRRYFNSMQMFIPTVEKIALKRKVSQTVWKREMVNKEVNDENTKSKSDD